MDFLNKISENWLKWTSLPFAFALDISFYVFTASELNDLPNVELRGREYLLLAIPFLLLLLGYVVGCCVHNAKHRKKMPQQEAAPAEKSKATRSKKILWLVFSGCFLAVAILTFVLMFTPNSEGFRDGNYVIWADEYAVALSPEVHKSYYLEGDPVEAEDGQLTDYPKRCVVVLDFQEDGTFTIAHNEKLLGVTPGKNGVGYGGEGTSILWDLEELDDGVYYIHNVDEDTYLKWYEAQQNWTSHPNIVDENKQQYRLRLERVK